MFSYKENIVIDGKGHMLGRLASTVAKQLLNGQKIVVVRCEALNLNMTRYSPARGSPFHFRATSRIFYKTARGCPTTIRPRQEVVVPQALRILRLKPGRKYYTDVITRLKERRKVKGAVYHARKKAM
ncbi:60S ribosomal protein L16 [Amylocarpus encephaloides]|uniref:60S ribosomal protein L16 n=1 Tax=Amylocarpus encephaloides TaxID=45428 RepID=A0A9P8C3R5_9HELO|nr:60S ribosomal protein L16 [Amylocarpus encephaloides]